VNRARSFFFVCLGILALALAYHFGATTATAQAPRNPVVAAFATTSAVVTANGDIYYSGSGYNGPYLLVANVFSGEATGQPKAKETTPAKDTK
jgi:hypothetical protein